MPEKRIGVFICHCGKNIAGTVDVEKVSSSIGKNVAYSTTYKYMCSDPGQKLLEEAIKSKKLDGVVVAACSPGMHEETFRKAAGRAGLNPYLCEIANIREQCSWVHTGPAATEKAEKIVRSAVAKVKLDEPLEPTKVGVTKKCLVIGGGIAGIQAALDVADAGFPVILVERSPTIGGKMSQLSETFPTLDCSQCILTPKMVAAAKHPNITLLTNSELTEVDGFVGNFKVKIRKNPRYVDAAKCKLCGACAEVCPKKVKNEFDFALSDRKAIFIPFPQAVPASYVIDMKSCVKCKKCAAVCEPAAIDYGMKPTIVEEAVGTIILAPGYGTYPKEKLEEYGGGRYKDVIDSLQFERMLSASGPTGGEIRRPSDNTVPKSVVFVQCVGSRDDTHLPYCSRVCCMYTAKHALMYKHQVHDSGEATVFYIDIRAAGKGYEEFVRKVQEEGVNYVRGKVSKIFEEDGKIVVWSSDTLTGKPVEKRADLVVLATGMVPSSGVKELAGLMKSQVDSSNFLKEAHPKLRPVESVVNGIYLCGAAHGPKDIPDTVAQASGAASKAMTVLSKDDLQREPMVAKVDEDLCSSCGICESLCPFSAVELVVANENKDKKKSAKVNAALCEGCGTCVAACPSGAARLLNGTDAQISGMITEATIKNV